MWPFTSKPEAQEPDNRPVSVAARAVALSLTTEPERWKIGPNRNQLHHDSNIIVEMDGWIRQPNLEDEPEANAAFMQEAIEKWIDARLKVPLPQDDEDEEDGDEE